MMAWLERKGQLYRIRFRYGGAVLSDYMSNNDNCLWPGPSGIGEIGKENA
jgi:hypothetical protein